MARLKFTNKAKEDLSNIWEYSFEAWSENQADSYYEFLMNTCEGIAKNPQLGKKYEGIQPNLLAYHAKKHIIFYSMIANNEILVVRILHESMDLKNRIME